MSGRNSPHSNALGKYREIIIAVAFFLLFDLAVLVLNFYTSFQIREDAVAINLAGRQRMLSQRMSKAALLTDRDFYANQPTSDATLELEKTVKLFDKTLQAFLQGGSVPGGDGKLVELKKETSEKGQALLKSTDEIWVRYKKALQPLIEGNLNPETLSVAVAAAKYRSLELLTQMNDYTNHLENVASQKARNLRYVQTAGIILALINFAFILFKFIRRLRENDRKVEAAQKETAEILDTVREGLFLLDPQFKIGSQYSASLPAILGYPVSGGEDFREILQRLVPSQTYAAACDYLDLLFGDRVVESLVRDINPLTNIEVKHPVEGSLRHLTLDFSRVMQQGKLAHILVSVQDVSTQMALEKELSGARQKAQLEVEIMLDMLKVNPTLLQKFLQDSERALLEINDYLRTAGERRSNHLRIVDNVFRLIHSVKGEAATLDLTLFENLAHQFEVSLTSIRSKGEITGDDLLALPLPLEEFLQRLQSVRELLKRLASYSDTSVSTTESAAFVERIEQLAERVAQDYGKNVMVESDLGALDAVDSATRTHLKTIIIQLLRNAVAHGIEPATQRMAADKPQAGRISVWLQAMDNGEYELTLRDDGAGIDPMTVRAQLLASGRYTDAQLKEWSDQQILLKIFEPGFSTAGKATRDAGHGVGMDVVKQKVQELGANLRLSTRKNQYTQFSLRFSI